MFKRTLMAATALTLSFAASAAHARTNIEMWIGLTGPAQELLIQFGQEFNAMQDDFQVEVSFRGQYPEQRAAAIAAFRAGNPPHIMQMFDAGTGDMFAARQAIVPVSEVYAKAGKEFDPSIFLSAAAGYYGAADGTLFSQPLMARPDRGVAPDRVVGRGPLRLHLDLDRVDHARADVGHP